MASIKYSINKALSIFQFSSLTMFNPKTGAWWKRLLRFLIGLVGVLVFWMGLDLVFPGNEDLISWVARYVRYGLVGFWISGLGPLVFIKLGLGEEES